MAREPLPNPVERLTEVCLIKAMPAKGATCFLGGVNGEEIAIPEGTPCYAISIDAARSGWALAPETYERLTTAPADEPVDDEGSPTEPPAEPPADKPNGKSGKNRN